MFRDDTYFESVINRYKLGLDLVQTPMELEMPILFRESWNDRFLFTLGKTLIALGSRLERHAISRPTAYHPV